MANYPYVEDFIKGYLLDKYDWLMWPAGETGEVPVTNPATEITIEFNLTIDDFPAVPRTIIFIVKDAKFEEGHWYIKINDITDIRLNKGRNENS